MAAGDISISPTGQSSAYLVIHAVLLVAVLILAILASKNVKKQGDQARRGFPWFVASLWLYSLYAAIVTIYYSAALSNAINRPATWQPFSRLDPFATLSSLLAQSALVLSLSELALGVKLAARNERSRAFRIFIFVVAALVAVIAVVWLVGRELSVNARVSYYWGAYAATGWLGFAALALLFIAMLATAIFALKQQFAAQRHAGGAYRGAAKWIAAAAWLAFGVYIWDLMASFVSIFALARSNANAAVGWTIAEAVVSRWGMFAVYVLIYLVGKRTTGGLWSGERTKTEGYEQQQVHGVGDV